MIRFVDRCKAAMSRMARALSNRKRSSEAEMEVGTQKDLVREFAQLSREDVDYAGGKEPTSAR